MAGQPDESFTKEAAEQATRLLNVKTLVLQQLDLAMYALRADNPLAAQAAAEEATHYIQALVIARKSERVAS